MLRQLQISNYAIIQDLDVRFDDGLSVITGETGAGKSILLGALGLILGDRADSRVLFDQSRKCVVEGHFDLKEDSLEAFFREQDLDYENPTVIRREINAAGKSRAFINDTPVRLNVLEGLASRLVNIHSQHETLDLQKSRFQIGVLDALAENGKRLSTYKKDFTAWQEQVRRLVEWRTQQEQALAERDYLQFQFNELLEASLDDVRVAELESELSGLQHAEDTRKGLQETRLCLDSEPVSLSAMLRQALSSLRPLLRWREDLRPVYERLESLRIESEDLTAELEQLEAQTHWDPERIDVLSARLDQINRLLHKHRVADHAALIALREDLDNRLQAQDSQEAELAKLEKSSQALGEAVRQQALGLREARKRAIPGLEKAMQKLLAEVGMPDARLKVELTEASQPGPSGVDEVQFLFASNKGSRFEELRQVASGGELSRLMLGIKSLISGKQALPTLIFDEIDTGVSGETGRRIGTLLEKLAQQHQVIAITHLPQIAACGNRHFFVYKDNRQGNTQTRIRELDGEERVEGIARMISGESISEAARLNARELLGTV